MLDYRKITWLHAEITNLCNAHCPACARNNNGYGLKEGLKLNSVNPSQFVSVIEQLPNLNTVQMCGTYGDPIASHWFKFIVGICVDRKFNVRIHTNGSLKTTEWWSELATSIVNTEHTVIFGIDGLADTHSYYRQGTNFDKIIENAAAFIAAGGQAEWQFLTFKHNIHQVKDCMRLSQKLGFKKFTVKKSIRIPTPARNYLTGEAYTIESDVKFNSVFNNNEKILTAEDCMHLSMPSIYMNADGTLSPCCYIRDLTYEANTIDSEFLDICKTYCGRNTVGHKN